jgi:hypothetical protein
MSWSLIACLVVSIAVSIVIVLGAIGAFNLSESTLVRTLATAVACAIGYLIGHAVHRRFFA